MNQHFSRCLRSTLFLTAMLALPIWAAAQVPAPAPAQIPSQAAEPAAPPSGALPGYAAESRRSSVSEVTAIDPAARMITLKEEGGEPQTFEVSKEARNLDQVKVGDIVKVDQYQSASIKVLPPGAVVNDDVATIQRSQPGEKPGGLATRTETMTTTVSSIFPGSNEFLTRNEKGQLRTWKVQDPKQLESLHSGDRIQLRLTSALAISVTPALKSTTAPATPAAAKTAPDASTPTTPAPATPATPAPATPAPATPAPAPGQ